MKSAISSKGQVTVPAVVRARLGLVPGTRVEWVECEGGVLMRKGGTTVHPVDSVFGAVRLARPVDRLLEEMRGSGDEDGG